MNLKIGVSFGSQNSPSAICVVEVQEPQNEAAPVPPDSAQDLLRMLMEGRVPEEEIPDKLALAVKFEQFPTGTAMVDVASRLCEMVKGEQDPGRGSQMTIYLDVTGKGEPLLDMFREKVPDYEIFPVYLTFDDQLRREDLRFTVGIQLLRTKVSLLFELGRLHMRTDHEAEVRKALKDYDVSLESDTNSRPRALLVALGLAVFERGVGIESRSR